MTLISGVFIVAGCFCILMVFVLASLLRFDEPGVAEWTAANVTAFVAHILYALARQLPQLVAIEIANGLYAFATIAVLAGFLRFDGRKVPVATFSAVLAVFVGILALFHYWYESFAARVIAFSVFHGTIMSIIAMTVFKARDHRHARYPFLFTGIAATLLVVVNVIRGGVYLFHSGEATSLLQPTAWGIFFMSVNALVLPVLTFGAMMMVHDRMLAHTADATSRDFLTGALAHNVFLQRMEREWACCMTTGRKMSVLMIEVDHLQSVRRECGNAAADQVMVNIALLADSVFRSSDCFARMGGAEFSALLPQTRLGTALELAQRLRRRVERSNVPGKPFPDTQTHPVCTVSIGLASLCDGESVADLLARGREALHAASAAGGNRVVCAEAEMHD